MTTLDEPRRRGFTPSRLTLRRASKSIWRWKADHGAVRQYFNGLQDSRSL